MECSDSKLRRVILLAATLVLVAGCTPEAQMTADQGEYAFPITDQRWERILNYGIGGLEVMNPIVDGDNDLAIAFANEILEKVPDHREVLFAGAIAHARIGDGDTAMEYVLRALDAGLPIERFLAGPRELLLPLYQLPSFQTLIRDRSTNLLHGPMLGDLTDRSARVWLRTANEARVTVNVQELGVSSNTQSSKPVWSLADNDYTAVLQLDGLNPSTNYSYTIRIDEIQYRGNWTFTTYPDPSESMSFEVGFGGCSRYATVLERVWDTAANHSLLAFLMLGDNEYIDNPEVSEMQRYGYYRRQSSKPFQRYMGKTPIYAIWDDHDFARNDSKGGPDPFFPEWKPEVWKVFQENWNNPSYGGGATNPGVWFRFSVGNVDFFMLDGRYYRSEPDGADSSMLGAFQKDWLFRELQSSTATFKVIVSPVSWNFEARPLSSDGWVGFRSERDEIFDFLADNKISGVILLSSDRHRADVWRITRDNGYDLYEFTNGRLSNPARHDLQAGAIFGYNEKPTFGILEFRMESDDPQVVYRIITIDDEEVFSISIAKSQLED